MFFFFGLQGTLSRLSSLRLAMSHHYYYKKMDEYGKDFAINVVQRVKNESERLKHQHGASSTQGPTPSASSSVVITPDKGRKIVFDNFDCKQHVHSMTEHHQNIDIHWVTHMAVENRVSGNHLSSVKPSPENLLQIENGLCLPSRHEHHLQRENCISLTERALVELPCLEFLKSVACKHIPHQFSQQMREKSEIVRDEKSLLACVHLPNCKIINIGLYKFFIVV